MAQQKVCKDKGRQKKGRWQGPKDENDNRGCQTRRKVITKFFDKDKGAKYYDSFIKTKAG